MKSEIAASMQAAKLMLVFTLLLGGGYTLIMTGLAQLFFRMKLRRKSIRKSRRLWLPLQKRLCL